MLENQVGVDAQRMCTATRESAHDAEGARATSAEVLQRGDPIVGNGEDLDGKRS